MYTARAFQVPTPLFTRSILLHYPGKSPRRLPQMLQQAKVSRIQHGTPKENQENIRPYTKRNDSKHYQKREIYKIQTRHHDIEDIPTIKEQSMRIREKRIPIITRNKIRKNRDTCYRNQNHVSGGSGEPNKSVSRKSENADIARSVRGSR